MEREAGVPGTSVADASQRRRIVVCCDGTWNSADSGPRASNVVRLARVVRPIAADGRTQVVYYHPGVGTGNGLDRLIGGGTGVGLSRNVRDAYAFIVNNWQRGDEILLFGFSRGAYTARSVGGLIGRIGLLRKDQMGRFADAWAYNRLDKEARLRSREEFERLFEGRRADVPISCIGVWDTVGALGIPGSAIAPCRSAYQFHDVELGVHVAHGFQALAIDEKRKAFVPAVWTRAADAPPEQVIWQTWFRGVHSDIGGGYDAHGAADLAFLWIAARVQGLVDLDAAAIAGELDRSERWANGTLHESWRGIYRLLAAAVQRPVAAGNAEAIHESVWMRDGGATYDPLKRDPLTDFETRFRWSGTQPTVVPPALSSRRDTLCDRIVRFLGGG